MQESIGITQDIKSTIRLALFIELYCDHINRYDAGFFYGYRDRVQTVSLSSYALDLREHKPLAISNRIAYDLINEVARVLPGRVNHLLEDELKDFQDLSYELRAEKHNLEIQQDNHSYLLEKLEWYGLV